MFYSRREIILFALTHLLMLSFFALLIFKSSPHTGEFEFKPKANSIITAGPEAGKK